MIDPRLDLALLQIVRRIRRRRDILLHRRLLNNGPLNHRRNTLPTSGTARVRRGAATTRSAAAFACGIGIARANPTRTTRTCGPTHICATARVCAATCFGRAV
ncbi:hypothetical protein GCM10010411_33570 [Actinomadura fulvescens]|uniref:Uncharacterized protein n=1 Tax=Actinomadura fulvescens TaxID=46160 RepID=A0ABN3PRJ4_9ACTN